MEYPSTFETGHRYQVHHSYIWLAPVAATFAFAFALIVYNLRELYQLVEEVERETGLGISIIIGIALLTLVLVYALLVAVYAVAYRFLSYEFGEKEFSLYSGFITKKHVHVPYARVQSVNHHASLLQRIFGVCSVSIDTAGGASNKAVRVPYVQLQTAELIRRDLFARKAAAAAGAHMVYEPQAAAGASLAGAFEPAAVRSQAPLPPDQLARQHAEGAGSPNLLEDAMGDVGTWRGAFGGDEIGMEPVSYEFGLTNRELVWTALSHASSTTLAAIMGLTGLVMGALLALPESDIEMMAGVNIIGGSIALAVIAVIVGWLIGFLGICIQFGGFRARRRGTRIEIERGLLQREYSGIDIQRVQSIMVRQSFIRRCLGYCEVSLGRIDAGSDQGSNSNSAKLDRRGLIVHPFVKLDRVDEVMAGLLPEYGDRPSRVDLEPLPPVALRRALTRRCVWYNAMLWVFICLAIVRQALLVAASTYGAAFGTPQQIAEMTEFLDLMCTIALVVFIVATVLRAIGAVLWQRGSGFTFNHGYAAMRNDGLATEFAIFPRTKIQYGFTRSNPFQRHAHVTGVTMVSAAGTGSTQVRVLDVREQQGDAWIDWLVPGNADGKRRDPIC